jgi:hypothetical protein
MLPLAFASGTAEVGRIASIDSIGNLRGSHRPYATGFVRNTAGRFTAGLLAVGVPPFPSTILMLILGHNLPQPGARVRCPLQKPPMRLRGE